MYLQVRKGYLMKIAQLTDVEKMGVEPTTS